MNKALVCLNVGERQFGSLPKDTIEIFDTKNPEKSINGLLKKFPRIVAYLITGFNGRNGEHFELSNIGLKKESVIWTPESDIILPDVFNSSNITGIEGEEVIKALGILRNRIIDKLTSPHGGRFNKGHYSYNLEYLNRLDIDFKL